MTPQATNMKEGWLTSCRDVVGSSAPSLRKRWRPFLSGDVKLFMLKVLRVIYAPAAWKRVKY